MPRLVLLGIEDKDVDVLSRIAGMEPRPEVVVIHPDPEALVLRLGALAELPISTQTVEPLGDDVVLISGAAGDIEPDLLEPWRREGARIVEPPAWDLELSPPDEGPSLRREESVVRALRETFDETATQKTADLGHALAEEPDMQPGPSPPAPGPEREEEHMTPISETPPPNIWESPEATFRYLVEQTVGEGSKVTLWWNGNTGVWVPWLWMGAAPAENKGGVELSSRYGEFRLTGAESGQDRLNVPALTRVAEDIALRDLASWQETERELRGRAVPDPTAAVGALEAWATPVLAVLGAQAVLLWRRDEDGWVLVLARGEGLSLSGELRMSPEMFAATFEHPGSSWRRWDPSVGLRLLCLLDGAGSRWPLMIHRVEKALAAAEEDS